MEHNVIYTVPYDSEVEYLESTGIQYINTEVIPKSKYRAICVYQTTYNSTSSVYALFGSRTSVNANDKFCVFVPKNSQDRSYYVQYANIKNPLSIVQNANDIHTVELGEDSYLDGRLIQSTRTTFRGTYKISLFVVNNGNTFDNRCFIGKIFSFKLYNELNVLIFDGIPVRVGSVGYMYDKVTGKLFGNKGTGNFILGPDVANSVPNIRRVFRFDNKRFVMPMPYDRRVEYLESTGTQYIDTGVIIDSETAFAGTSVDFQAVNINNGTCVIAGSVLSEGANRYKNLNLLVYNNKFYIDGAGWRFNNNVNDITLRTIATATGTAKGISRKQFLLFARYVVGLGASTSNSGCRIFSCKIYKNEILICDLIPVRKDNVGYMYDRVSGKLFGNAGTGQFILGQDIND